MSEEVVIEIGRVYVRAGWRVATFQRIDIEVMAHLAGSRRCVTRDVFLREVWGSANPEKLKTRVVDVRISKLRRLIAWLWPDAMVQIVPVRGRGYLFRPSVLCPSILGVVVTLLPDDSLDVEVESPEELFAWSASYLETRRMEERDEAEARAQTTAEAV